MVELNWISYTREKYRLCFLYEDLASFMLSIIWQFTNLIIRQQIIIYYCTETDKKKTLKKAEATISSDKVSYSIYVSAFIAICDFRKKGKLFLVPMRSRFFERIFEGESSQTKSSQTAVVHQSILEHAALSSIPRWPSQLLTTEVKRLRPAGRACVASYCVIIPFGLL